jgi:CRISPR-associated Cas5-like protein
VSLALIRVEGVFHWGFWVRQAYASARQDTVPLPPPSTLVGALASGLAAVLRDVCKAPVAELGYAAEAIEVPLIAKLVKSGAVIETYFKVVDGYGIKRVDITRMFQAPYIRRANLQDVMQWFAVRTVGKVYSPHMRFEAAYLVDLAKAESIFKGVCKGLAVESLLKLGALSISRIGPVEGVVTVLRTCLDKASPSTITSIPMSPCPYFEIREDLASKLRQAQLAEATLIEFWDWKDPDFWTSRRSAGKMRPYIAPLNRSSVESGIITPFKPCTFIKDIISSVGKGIYVEDKLYPCSSC